MALTFPNPTRSYDTKHRCVRFWGYDGTFEITLWLSSAFSRGSIRGQRRTNPELWESLTSTMTRFLVRSPRLPRAPSGRLYVGCDRFLSWQRVRARRQLVTDYIPNLNSFGGATYPHIHTAEQRVA